MEPTTLTRFTGMSRVITALLGIVFVTACGGGGSGSPPAPPPPNQAPTANAGADQTIVEGLTASLSAAGSTDVDGSITAYAWAQTSGTAVTIDNANMQTAQFSAPLTNSPLNLEFEVTVTDNDGDAASDSTTITIDPSQPPMVGAGTDFDAVETQTVQLDAAVSDADGTVVAFDWQQLSGPAVMLNDPSAEDPSFVAPAVAALTDLEFELTATDSTNDSASDRVVVTVNPNEAPELAVQFPCDGCRFFGSTIAVSGIVDNSADNNFVASVDNVTGVSVDAGSGPVDALLQSDGRWLAQNVPIATMQQSIVIDVIAGDSFGESGTSTVVLERKPTITAASIVLDATAPDLVYFVEQSNPLDRVLSFDASTGAFQPIYEASDELSGFGQVQSVRLDSIGNRLLVNTYFSGITAVDIATGVLEVIADDSTGTGATLDNSLSADFDADDDRIVIYNPGTSSLVAVDIATGNRTVISDNSGTGSGSAFVDATFLAVDASNDITYLRESGDNYVAVDLSNGARTLLPRVGVASNNVSSLLYDTGRSRLAVLDWISDQVVTVDPVTGLRAILSDQPADATLTTGNAPELAFDLVSDRYVMNDFSSNVTSMDTDQLLSVDPVTGARSVLYKDSLGTGPSVQSNAALGIDLTNRFAYLGSEIADSIIQVDLDSGDRQTIADDTTGSGLAIGTIRALAYDAQRDQLLMIDGQNATLSLVAPANGNRTLISGGLVGVGSAFSLPVSVDLDESSDTAYIVDQSLRAIVAVNMQTGDRSILSDDNSAGTPFIEPTGVTTEAVNGRLLVTDNGDGSTPTVRLFAVDLATGERTVVSALGTGSGNNFQSLNDVEIVPGRDLAIVSTGESLVIVDLQTGNRTLLADNASGNGESIVNLLDIAFDPASNTTYGWHTTFEALFQFSAATGDRVVLSK